MKIQLYVKKFYQVYFVFDAALTACYSSNGPNIKMMNNLNIKVCKKHSSVFSELLCDVEIGLFSQQE